MNPENTFTQTQLSSERKKKAEARTLRFYMKLGNCRRC